jgi:Rho family protein
VEVKWLDEIHEHCPGVKLCLVALKCDLREDQGTIDKLARIGEQPVTYEQVSAAFLLAGPFLGACPNLV